MKNIKVFNVEFDGIDKSGKDTIMQQMFSVVPNLYIPKSRGLLSQIAYSKIYERDYFYEVSKGYIENTLFVWLDVDEEDWKVRCDISKEHLLNKFRSDMEGDVIYETNRAGFKHACCYLRDLGANVLYFNTSRQTPYQIIQYVVHELEVLNE